LYTNSPDRCRSSDPSIFAGPFGPPLWTFDPDHYVGRRSDPTIAVATKELVSTFGHGIHVCPAQRFSISAIRAAVIALIDRYHLAPQFTVPGPLTGQISEVARADSPCPFTYAARRTATGDNASRP
jgi:hypothetical protein